MPVSLSDLVAATYEQIIYNNRVLNNRATEVEGRNWLSNTVWSGLLSKKEKRKMSKWTLTDGIALVRALQEKAKEFNYHVTIGGGVVNKGESDKDLDLFFLALESKGKPDPAGLIEYLKTLWGNDFEEMPNYGADGQRAIAGSMRLNLNGRYEPVDPTPLVESIYANKIKFFRDAGDGGYDRIDVFISK